MENKELYTYMATLLEAGFEPQSVLEKGHEAAWSVSHFINMSGMQSRQMAADMVRDAAKALGINHASCIAAYTKSDKPATEPERETL